MISIRTLRIAVLLMMLGGFGMSLGCRKAAPQPPPATIATIETDHGTIQIDLLPAIAPKTVQNFRLLAERGYYNSLTFHRAVTGFMIQGGDPLGNGMGGESAWGAPFEDEIDSKSPLYRGGYKRGTLAMANKGKNTNTSQFFIVQTDFPLSPDYTIFGRVTQGMEVVDKIIALPTTRGIDGRNTQLATPPVIKKVTVTGPPVTLPEQGQKQKE